MGYIEEDEQVQTNPELNETTREPRPTWLTILCILTFIGSGFNLLGWGISFLIYHQIPGLMESFIDMASSMNGMSDSMIEQYQTSMEMIMSIPRFYYALCAISAILAIMGAAFMMAMRKVGFHLYVASQILLACLPLFVASQSMNYGGIIISMCFIAMYAVYYKKMR